VYEHVAYHSLHPMHCIYAVSHTCIFVIGHMEQGLEEPPEPAPVEVGSYEQDKVSPGASKHNS
jgi:hypothetical protein